MKFPYQMVRIDIQLAHCALETPYHVIEIVNIGSDDGLLPDNYKQLPEPMLTSHQWGPVIFTWKQFLG